MWKVDDSEFTISTFPYRLYIILMRNNANYKRKGTMSMAIIGIIGDGHNEEKLKTISDVIALSDAGHDETESNSTSENTDVEKEHICSSDFITKRFMTVI